MDDKLAKNAPKIQADNQSIAIGEINISGTVTGNITIGHTIVQPADARLRHELGILLKNIQTTWIKGVLEKSVHEVALLELGLELREEAVDNPWRMVMEAPDQTRETLQRGRRIKDIFDEANRLLLILGEPGSGKTTTLLQLARDLVAEVDSAFTQPVPVILNLSTWTNKTQPLAEWLVAELNSKYRLPKKDGQRWLKERRILPLLDGLDEVRGENRGACVERINQLVTDYGLQGMVICSRIKDYTVLNVRLAFDRAIYIQPLTPDQVDEYLNEAGDKLASLRVTLQADEALRSMAQSPLILNIMSLAYQNSSAEDLSNPVLNTDKARRKHLFDTYIARMFNRKASARLYEAEQTKQRLSWLAQNIQRHNQEVFLIEGLQPSWLQTRGWQRTYLFFSRMAGALALWIMIPLMGRFSEDTQLNLEGGLVFGSMVGLTSTLIDALWFEWLRKRVETRKSPRLQWRIVKFLVVWLIVYTIFIVSFGIWGILMDKLEIGLNFGLTFGLIAALSAGLIFGLRGSQQSLDSDIQTVEFLSWSWRKAIRGGLVGTAVGLIVGFFLGTIAGWSLIFRIIFAMIAGLSVGTLSVVINGFSREIIATKSHPNQGVWLSIRNALFGGLIAGLSAGVMAGLITGFYVVITDGLIIGLRTGLVFGLIGVLWFGGFDIIQHSILRLMLLVQAQTPINYARFLDYAVDRIFLQKVGGGYRFIHRLLLEHFAEMGEVKKI